MNDFRTLQLKHLILWLGLAILLLGCSEQDVAVPSTPVTSTQIVGEHRFPVASLTAAPPLTLSPVPTLLPTQTSAVITQSSATQSVSPPASPADIALGTIEGPRELALTGEVAMATYRIPIQREGAAAEHPVEISIRVAPGWQLYTSIIQPSDAQVVEQSITFSNANAIRYRVIVEARSMSEIEEQDTRNNNVSFYVSVENQPTDTAQGGQAIIAPPRFPTGASMLEITGAGAGLRAYLTPSTSAEFIYTLRWGDRVLLHESWEQVQNETWLQVELVTGRFVYIENRSGGTRIVNMSEPPNRSIGTAIRVTASGEGMSLRSSASTLAEEVSPLRANSIFRIIGGPRYNEFYYWWQVELLDGRRGWVMDVAGWWQTHAATWQNIWNAINNATSSRYSPCNRSRVPAIRLDIGERAWVLPQPPQPNGLFANPTGDSQPIAFVPAGEVFLVIAGPVCAGDRNRWQLLRYDGSVGWTAEGTLSAGYWLGPYE